MILELEKARRFKAKLKSGKHCWGAQLALSDPAVAEIFGRAGYDYLIVDTEHTSTNLPTVRAMLQAAAHTDAVLLARPLRFDADEIRRLLDLGSPDRKSVAEGKRVDLGGCRIIKTNTARTT